MLKPFYLFSLSAVLSIGSLVAQEPDSAARALADSAVIAYTDSLTTAKDTSYWTFGAIGTAGFTNTGQSTYWQAGGITSQSIAGRIDANAKYLRGKIAWQNDLILALGAVKQGKSDESRFIKNQDRIEFGSKLGRNINEKFLITGLMSFRTQFLPGFVFPANQPTIMPSDTVSGFLAPAFLEFGLGMDYQPGPNFSIYFSPISSKVTIVTVEAYRPLYIPQEVTTGSVRYELGSNLKLKWNQPIAENILFATNANFFTNYLQNFPSVDINWETLTTAKVNSWFAVTFATNLIYDEDILFDIVNSEGESTGRKGPRTQFQHVLSLGVTYTFF